MTFHPDFVLTLKISGSEFQAKADTGLQTRLGTALPSYDLNSIREALTNILKIVESDLAWLTNSQIELTDTHTALLNRIRERSVIAD